MTKVKTVLTPSHTNRTKPKGKLTRVYGENLWGADKAPVNKRSTRPGQHGGARKKMTDFGIQLREKQKLKNYYGNVGERQFRNIFAEASRRKGDTSENLVGLLESRLDAIVFRLNLAPTVFAARQLVNHKHVQVNGQCVNIPSYRCKPGDVVEVREKAKAMTAVAESVQKMSREVPEYLTFDPAGLKGTFVRMPTLEEVPYAVQMNPNLVVEFYNR
ncbi:MAG: 30S ribosomal protein S4 [Pseudomonadaceae bacterium]|nr:30S ribosomal protein S4 [Pseudomonadaceae bacterium]